jgi:hypothetical protein
MLCLAVSGSLAFAADETSLMPEQQFQDQLRELDRQSSGAEKLRHSLGLTPRRWFSSLQVKTICARLPGDAERLEFATAAFPRVVDPENFYEVYDAFSSFSKVLRLHDRVRSPRRDEPPPVVVTPVSETDLEAMLKTLRAEPFEDTRLTMAKQMLQVSRRNFLSRQALQMVKCFRFEENRLTVAKLAFDAVLDPENYFVVNEAFSFAQTRQELADYILNKKAPPR